MSSTTLRACMLRETQFWATMVHTELDRRTRRKLRRSVFKKVVLMGIYIVYVGIWNIERCAMFVMTRVSENFECILIEFEGMLGECWWNVAGCDMIFKGFFESVLIESWQNVEEMLKGCWENVERVLKECWESVEGMLRECWENVEGMSRECWWRVLAIMSVISLTGSLVEVSIKLPLAN